MKILIAEDDPLSRLLLRKGIERQGHQCTVVADGRAAWESFVEETPDVIISDWIMPGMDGLELCRRVRERTSFYTYFIVLTSNDALVDRVRGFEAGADDYLTKPLNLEDLTLRLMVAERITALHRELQARRDELEALNENLYLQGRRDALTGVANRLQLREDLIANESRARRTRRGFSVALFDIDLFKPYNDSLGHVAGDEALKAVATALADACRAEDRVYRYGGEEFCAVFQDESIAGALHAAERMRRAVLQLQIPHPATAAGAWVSLSGGVADYDPDRPTSIDDLLRRADDALYSAKDSGRNTVHTNTDHNYPLERSA